jgi:hypothetical protein
MRSPATLLPAGDARVAAPATLRANGPASRGRCASRALRVPSSGWGLLRWSASRGSSSWWGGVGRFGCFGSQARYLNTEFLDLLARLMLAAASHCLDLLYLRLGVAPVGVRLGRLLPPVSAPQEAQAQDQDACRGPLHRVHPARREDQVSHGKGQARNEARVAQPAIVVAADAHLHWGTTGA